MNSTTPSPPRRRRPFRLLLVTDRAQLPADALVSTIEAALAGGVDAVQLREKDLDTRALLRLAQKLRPLTQRHDAVLLVNDRIDVALAVGADGVHLPTDSFDPRDARALLGPHALIGVSTHSRADAVSAAQRGADYVVFGPIYDTPSKQRYGAALGLEALGAVTTAVQIPVLAIGGIDESRVAAILQQGAAGVAVISALLRAADPGTTAATLRAALGT